MLGPALGHQRLPQSVHGQLDRADLLGQPAGELVLVADGGFPEPQRLADLGAVVLDGAA